MNPPNRPVLSLRGWSLDRRVAGGTRPVLQDIDLDLVAGRWLAVVGANGSGKSSLLKYLASDDSPIADRTTIMFQDPDEQIFATGVDRELTLGHPARDPAPLRDEFGLAGTGDLNPRLLSAGQKQRLVLAVALADGADVLLCDEPTSLQDPQQTTWVLDRLERWRAETGGVLVTATCDRLEAARADDLLVLDRGRVVAQGPRADLWHDAAVEAVLGPEDPRPMIAARAEGTGEPALRMDGVACRFAGGGGLADVDLAVAAGARRGLIGPNGCGKSTLLAVAAGARRPEAGRVRLGQRELYRGRGPDLDHGRALLAPQFPEYFFSRATVADEISLDPALGSVPAGDFLSALGLPADLAGRNPHDLSAGQRRRLALGLVLRSGRPLVLLDEPTAALDAAGRRQVLALLDRLPAGTALVIASHDRDFLARAGCRVLEVTPRGLRGAD